MMFGDSLKWYLNTSSSLNVIQLLFQSKGIRKSNTGQSFKTQIGGHSFFFGTQQEEKRKRKVKGRNLAAKSELFLLEINVKPNY
jgi:hypothetical protein